MDDEKRITLRIPADLHDRLAEHARRDRRSLNSQNLYLLEAALDAIPDAGSPDDKPA